MPFVNYFFFFNLRTNYSLKFNSGKFYIISLIKKRNNVLKKIQWEIMEKKTPLEYELTDLEFFHRWFA